MVAYFIRRRGDVCSVIELHADNLEEVVQDGLSPIEAEILCLMKMADIPRPATQQTDAPVEQETGTSARRTARQLALKNLARVHPETLSFWNRWFNSDFGEERPGGFG